ncbi:MAG: sensor histidine kinase [Thermoanaerobaculia bacterium]
MRRRFRPPVSRRPTTRLRRVVPAALLALGLFVALDLSLFGWLIFRSLSQHEIERVLLDTREQAEDLAERIADRAERTGQDIYTAIAVERETRSYLNSILQQRDLVQRIEVTDENDVLVYKADVYATIPNPEAPSPGTPSRELPGQLETETVERTTTYPLEVPIGDIGMIRIGISQHELEERIDVLRRALVRQAGVIAAVTLLALILGGVAFGWLWRRTQRAEETARERERLAYLGTLASGLAHEIRNPLNSLSLNMQLIEEEVGEVHAPGEPAGRRGLLAITRSELARLERLVSDFLAYARPPELRPEVVAAADLMERARQVLAAQIAERGAKVSLLDSSEGAWVQVDPAQFSQLLLNLVHNALAATEGTPRAPRVELSVGRRPGRVVFQVTDNGRGIPQEERGRIFELFYSTRKGGTGLGLAIVDRIARAHDAELEVVSMRDSGTTFRVLVPALPQPVTVPARARPATEPA